MKAREVVQIRAERAWKKRLVEASKASGMDVSVIVRRAVDAYLPKVLAAAKEVS